MSRRPARRQEYFHDDTSSKKFFPSRSCSLTPPALYKQNRDWSCSLACARTILSGILGEREVPSEEELIERCALVPGPHYSEELKASGIFADAGDVIWGCDHPDITLRQLFSYMEQGYYLMAESMYNYAHWYVLLAYYETGSSPEYHKIAAYDPYYDEIRLLNADEFAGMWIDGNYAESGVERDFIAVKRRAE